MSAFLFAAALVILLSLAASLVRTHLGPGDADRIGSAQLVGTGGVAVILLLASERQDAAMVDVALVLGLLAAFAAVAFVKAASPDGAGDPEEDE